MSDKRGTGSRVDGPPRRLSTVGISLLALTVAALAGTAALAQAGGTKVSNARVQEILGKLTGQPDAYNSTSGLLKPVITLAQTALIPGFPVRQQPVNLGQFDTHGCSQCHRLAGPLPVPNDAPKSVFSSLATPAAAGAAPSGFTRLTTGAAEQTSPYWSPDGKHILYSVRSAGGQWTLWVMNADGTDQRQLTTRGNTGWANWSPDGQSIAYWSSDRAGHSSLWLMKADGTGKQRLTDDAMVAFPVWSPDGRAIAYQARSEHGDWQIDLLHMADGSTMRLTPPGQASPSRPQWSPDGREIAYQVSYNGAFGLWRLIFPPTASEKPDYSETPRSLPSSTLLPLDIGQAKGNTNWRPQGGRITLQMPALVTVPTGQLTLSYKTWITNPNGTNPTLLVPTETLADRDPTWSPDGSWIAQWSWNRDLMAAVWLVRPDGVRAIDLTAPLRADAMYPDWSPDGTKIAFSSDRSGHFDIWVADLAAAVPDYQP